MAAGNHRHIARRRRGQRFASESKQARENAALRFALEVTFSRDAAIVFAACVVENDAGPVAGRKVCFADVGNVSGTMAADPDALADDEAVSVGGQNDVLIWYDKGGESLSFLGF